MSGQLVHVRQWVLRGIASAVVVSSSGAPSLGQVPVDRVVTVDAATGSVEYPNNTTPVILRPLDRLRIKVKRADLIHYTYVVKLISAEAIVANYPLVGGGNVHEAPASQTVEAMAMRMATHEAAEVPTIQAKLSNEVQAAVAKYLSIASAVADMRASVAVGMQKVTEMDRGPGRQMPATGGWPAGLAEVARSFAFTYQDLATRSLAARKSIDALRDILFDLSARGALTADEVKVVTQVSDGLTKVSTDLDSLMDAATKLSAETGRWQRILVAMPSAEIFTDFVIDRDSKRYTFSVTRQALADAVAEPAAADAPTPVTATPETVATIIAESHPISHLILSVGIAAIFTPQSRSFGLVDQVDGDKVRHFVRETDRADFRFRGAALLGAYLPNLAGKWGVDNLDPNRGMRGFVFGGTEINSSIEHYFAGLGLDFPAGVVLGLSVTNYKQALLATGYTNGQEIPNGADGKPLVSTIPTRSKQSVGYALILAFRPAIFSMFQKAQKAPS